MINTGFSHPPWEMNIWVEPGFYWAWALAEPSVRVCFACNHRIDAPKIAYPDCHCHHHKPNGGACV